MQVAEGILWMRLPLPLRLDHVNVYALDEGESWTLIDTGMDTAKSRDVWTTLLQGPLGGKPVGRVVVTHHHPDHVGLAGWFQTAHGADLQMSRAAWLTARALILDEQKRPTRASLEFARAAGADAHWLDKRAAERPFNMCDIAAPLDQGFTRLRAGDVVRLGGRDWQVRLSEGHAPEHVTLWSRDDALVIAADQVLPTITPILGLYPTEPSADPVGDYLASLAELRPHATADQLVLCGHKLPFIGLADRLDALDREHRATLAKLRGFLKEPKTATACFPILFRSIIDDENYTLALSETMACLTHLLHAGAVRRYRRGGDGVWLWERTSHG